MKLRDSYTCPLELTYGSYFDREGFPVTKAMFDIYMIKI